uniref:ANIS5_cation-bd domain-containing protein n=1 Tax=Panagrellus redivivus TaxID=6233 RepID=A0A7E4VG14_PANRE
MTSTTMRFVICVFFVLSILRFSTANDSDDSTFPFLNGLSTEVKNQFTTILWAWDISFAEKHRQLDAWAAEQSPEVQEQYKTWATEAIEFINTVIQRHKEKSQGLSPAAQAADDTYVQILEDENLTPQQKCLQLLDLYNNATDEVRHEARLHRPIGSNCTMNIAQLIPSVAPTTIL